jgi:hypothetical protein
MTKYIIIPYNIKFDFIGGSSCDFYNKSPHIVGHVKRIIAIGDIHGDFTLLLLCLKLAKLIDNNNNWIGNDSVVVQVGDQIDNCREINNCINYKYDKADDVKILMYMTDLHLQAEKSGGAVYSLIGNHELMNIDGDMRYVSQQNILAFGKTLDEGIYNRIKFFERGGDMATKIACTRNSGIIIGSLLFIHAGILPKLAKTFDIQDINKLIRRWILGKDISKYTKQLDILKNNPNLSPFWLRLFGDIDSGLPSDNINCKKINKTLNIITKKTSKKYKLDTFKLKGMIIGHTPQFYPHNLGINNTCGDKIWRVDFGGSSAFNNHDNGKYHNIRKPQVLEILDDMSNEHNLTFNILR